MDWIDSESHQEPGQLLPLTDLILFPQVIKPVKSPGLEIISQISTRKKILSLMKCSIPFPTTPLLKIKILWIIVKGIFCACGIDISTIIFNWVWKYKNVPDQRHIFLNITFLDILNSSELYLLKKAVRISEKYSYLLQYTDLLSKHV